MKKLLKPTLTGIIFLAALPSIAPAIDISAIFPCFSSIYSTIENAVRSIIPDEIENLVAVINDTLN